MAAFDSREKTWALFWRRRKGALNNTRPRSASASSSRLRLGTRERRCRAPWTRRSYGLVAFPLAAIRRLKWWPRAFRGEFVGLFSEPQGNECAEQFHERVLPGGIARLKPRPVGLLDRRNNVGQQARRILFRNSQIG